MARPLRIEMANGLYHVTVRGWEWREIVRSDWDRDDWLRLLDRVAVRCRWRLFAWALMSNHFHLFLRTPEPNLSAGMHDLNSGYASLFNRRHRRSGSLYQGRFKAILVHNQSHAWELTRYIHLNPVRAEMVELPEQYAWSSYRAFRFVRDAASAPDWLDWQSVLLENSQDLRLARGRYQRFVEAGIVNPPVSPIDTAVGGILLGDASWVEQMRWQVGETAQAGTIERRRELTWRPGEATVRAIVLKYFGCDIEDLQQPRRHGNDARTAVVYLLRQLTGSAVTDLARQFGSVSVAAISKLLSRAELRRQEEADWDQLLRELEAKCLTSRPEERPLLQRKLAKLNVKT